MAGAVRFIHAILIAFSLIFSLRTLAADKVPACVQILAMTVSNQKLAETLKFFSAQPDSHAYFAAFASAMANPNVSEEFKDELAEEFQNRTKNVSAAKIWPYIQKFATSTNMRDRIRVYLSLADKTFLPDAVLDAVAKEFSSYDSRLMASLYKLLRKLESVRHPEMITSLRKFYFWDIKGDRPYAYNFGGMYPRTADELRNIRIAHRAQALYAQLLAIELVAFRSTLDRSSVFEDIKRLVFVPDYRSHWAFKVMIEKDLLDIDFALKIRRELNDGKNADLAALLEHHFSYLTHEMGRNPNVEILIVELLQSNNIEFRSQVLTWVRNQQLHSRLAVDRLKQIVPRLNGQSRAIAQGIYDRSLQGFQPLKPYIGEDQAAFYPKSGFDHLQRILPTTTGASRDFIQMMIEGSTKPEAQPVAEKPQLTHAQMYLLLLADAVKDASEFSGIPAAKREEFKNLISDEYDVKFQQAAVRLFDQFPWGRQAVEKPKQHFGGDLFPWTQLGTPDWNAVPADEHSMPDIDKYLKDRLGRYVLWLGKKDLIDVVVIASTEENMMGGSDLRPDRIARIPNPYSDWDIDRYVEFSGEKLKVIFRVQPNLQLARHYQAMFRQAGVKTRVLLSEAGRTQLKSDFVVASARLAQKLGADVDTLVMGYEYLWKSILEKDPHWQLRGYNREAVTVGQAQVQGQRIVLRSAETGKDKVILVIGSERTLWGEASAHLAAGMIRALPNVQDFNFLGSAGSLGHRRDWNDRRNRNAVYALSLPWDFIKIRNGRKEKTNEWNSLNHEDKCSIDPMEAQTEIDGQTLNLVLCSHHGFSNSPAEQTIEKTSMWSDFGINTVDVETNLIKDEISKFNGEGGAGIRFAAGHLLTDNPASRALTWDTNGSLSNVDAALKQQIRENLVKYVIRSWRAKGVFSVQPRAPEGGLFQ